MDSGNSTGSLQSSSTNGGDEESYDSRADSSSISAFLNNVGGPISNPTPPPAAAHPHPPHQHHNNLSFDHYSLSNYQLDPTHTLSRPPNPLLNLDMVWSKTLRSDPNCTDLLAPPGSGFIASSSSSACSSHQITLKNRATTAAAVANNNNFNQFPPLDGNSIPGINIDQNNPNIPVRNPKKRSRASRRAPTTVLTTDTTNFRAMVQEFTGIPAPPFTSNSPFPRTRLDLFGGMSSSSFLRSPSSSTTNTNLLDPSPPPPPYLLRPFPHKIQPIINNSTTTTTTTSTTTATCTSNGNINNNTNSTSINYQLLSSGPPPPSLLNMQLQNPIFNLHSLLQPPTTKPSLDPSNHHDNLKIGVLDELGLGSHGGHLLNNMVSSTTSTDMVGTLRNNNDFLATSISDFNGDHKVLQENNVGATTTRTEGMVESWICSSD